MTTPEIRTALDALNGTLDGILRESIGILPDQPTAQEISAYSAAITSLSFAMADIDRALVHIDEMKKGGE